MSENEQKFFDDKRRVALTVFAVIAVIVLIIGLCLSWFVSNKTLSTAGKMAGPQEIKITGPNETSMAEIDLSYNADELQSHEVGLERTFSVVSGSEFYLYLARTTNIPSLNIELHRVSVADAPSGDTVTVYDDNGAAHYWKRTGDNLYNETSGSFINRSAGGAMLGSDTGNQIFGGYSSVQGNAIPLYWRSNDKISVDSIESAKYTDSDGNKLRVTNFIIDVSWTDANKETDVLYLIAES